MTDGPNPLFVGLFVLAQWALVLMWMPFQFAARVFFALFGGARYLGDTLIRPLYWAVVRAKRRQLDEPLWQEIDYRIGVYPPCESCGEHVPPGRHRPECAFLQPCIEDGVLQRFGAGEPIVLPPDERFGR